MSRINEEDPTFPFLKVPGRRRRPGRPVPGPFGRDGYLILDRIFQAAFPFDSAEIFSLRKYRASKSERGRFGTQPFPVNSFRSYLSHLVLEGNRADDFFVDSFVPASSARAPGSGGVAPGRGEVSIRANAGRCN